MIGFKINGRLGNQMFQLSSAYALAIKYNTRILPDERTGKYYVAKYFKTSKLYPWHWKIVHYIGNMLSPKIYHYYTKWILPIYYNFFNLEYYEPQNFMKISYEFHTLPNNTLLNGYFQSEYYFSQIKNSISHQFTLKNKYIQNWKRYIKCLPEHKKLIAIHIRLSDYNQLGHLNLGGDNLQLSSEYYIKLLENVYEKNSLILVLSDEPKIVANWFNSFENVVISNETEIIDFITLTEADICILSHSTFSWWGAWLNKKKNKKVFIPKYFLGYKIKQEMPENIIPTEWIQTEVKI
jgi:hypothetical protein